MLDTLFILANVWTECPTIHESMWLNVGYSVHTYCTCILTLLGCLPTPCPPMPSLQRPWRCHLYNGTTSHGAHIHCRFTDTVANALAPSSSHLARFGDNAVHLTSPNAPPVYNTTGEGFSDVQWSFFSRNIAYVTPNYLFLLSKKILSGSKCPNKLINWFWKNLHWWTVYLSYPVIVVLYGSEFVVAEILVGSITSLFRIKQNMLWTL